MSLPPPFQPEPDPQNPKDDDGRQADPKRDLDTPCSHLYPEEDSKQLREGHQPEHDRRDEPRLPLHPGVFPDDGLVRQRPRSAANRTRSFRLLLAALSTARRLQRAVRQPSLAADRSCRV